MTETNISPDNLKQIRELIGQSKLENAIKRFQSFDISQNDKDLLVLKQRQLTDVKDLMKKETATPGHIQIEMNKISNSLLGLLSQIEKQSLPYKNKPSEVTPFKNEDEVIKFIGTKLEFRFEILDVIAKSDRSILVKLKDKHVLMNQEVFKVLKIIKPFSIIESENRDKINPDVKELRKLSEHEGIITIEDQNTDTYPWYFIMPFINGKTLIEHLQEKKKTEWGISKSLQIIKKIVKAVSECHKKGFRHGNLRPDKIIIKDGETPMILPFTVLSDSYYVKRTLERMYKNCLYMCPHELNAKANSSKNTLIESEIENNKSDQFSIGLIAFEIFEGKPLYDGNTPLEIISRRMDHEKDPNFVIKKLRRKKYPKRLIKIIDKLLRCNPSERFENMSKVLQEFDFLISDHKRNTIYAEEVQKSFKKCQAKEDFIETFYEDFITESKKINKDFNKFENSNLKKQSIKLNKAIDLLLDHLIKGSYEVDEDFAKHGKEHSKKYKVENYEYEIFKDTLLKNINIFDPEYSTNHELQLAWDWVLTSGIKKMKGHSQ